METMLVWGLALLAIAALLAVVELFLPTAGILALVSLTVAGAGVFCLFRYDTTWGLIGTLIVIVGGPVAAILGLQIMPNTPLGRRLVLGNPNDEDLGPNPVDASANQLNALMGQEGIVISDLRPIGVIRINDRHYDALAESTLIRAGTKIRVTIIEGNQLKVRAVV